MNKECSHGIQNEGRQDKQPDIFSTSISRIRSF